MGYTNKLTKDEREDIRKEYDKGGVTQTELARQYGVTPSTICNVVGSKADIDKLAENK